MAQFGATMTFIVIIFIIMVVGLLIGIFYMPIQLFLTIGANSGADAGTLTILRAAIFEWFPISTIFCCIVYAWRKSSARIA
jgi:hypothetical protein